MDFGIPIHRRRRRSHAAPPDEAFDSKERAIPLPKKESFFALDLRPNGRCRNLCAVSCPRRAAGRSGPAGPGIGPGWS